MKIVFIILALSIPIVAPFLGQTPITISNIFTPNSIDYKLFWDLRLPRVIEAFFVGGALSLGGFLFQSLFRNPMSTPFTLGVASGATLGSAFAIVFGLNMVSLFGFFGAIFSILILFLVSTILKTYETNSLLLVGIALSFFYSAALMVLFYLSDETQSYEIVRFTMGSLDIVGFDTLLPIVTLSTIQLSIILYYKSEIKLLLTSYDYAFLKGIEVKKITMILLLIVSISIGVIVSITGPIGFIGLIIPHILKIIYKQSSEKLILQIFFWGGIFLLFCDIVSRTISSTSNIPIGVVTSFLGGPFFIYLIIRNSRI